MADAQERYSPLQVRDEGSRSDETTYPLPQEYETPFGFPEPRFLKPASVDIPVFASPDILFGDLAPIILRSCLTPQVIAQLCQRCESAVLRKYGVSIGTDLLGESLWRRDKNRGRYEIEVEINGDPLFVSMDFVDEWHPWDIEKSLAVKLCGAYQEQTWQTTFSLVEFEGKLILYVDDKDGIADHMLHDNPLAEDLMIGLLHHAQKISEKYQHLLQDGCTGAVEQTDVLLNGVESSGERFGGKVLEFPGLARKLNEGLSSVPAVFSEIGFNRVEQGSVYVDMTPIAYCNFMQHVYMKVIDAISSVGDLIAEYESLLGGYTLMSPFVDETIPSKEPKFPHDRKQSVPSVLEIFCQSISVSDDGLVGSTRNGRAEFALKALKNWLNNENSRHEILLDRLSFSALHLAREQDIEREVYPVFAEVIRGKYQELFARPNVVELLASIVWLGDIIVATQDMGSHFAERARLARALERLAEPRYSDLLKFREGREVLRELTAQAIANDINVYQDESVGQNDDIQVQAISPFVWFYRFISFLFAFYRIEGGESLLPAFEGAITSHQFLQMYTTFMRLMDCLGAQMGHDEFSAVDSAARVRRENDHAHGVVQDSVPAFIALLQSIIRAFSDLILNIISGYSVDEINRKFRSGVHGKPKGLSYFLSPVCPLSIKAAIEGLRHGSRGDNPHTDSPVGKARLSLWLGGYGISDIDPTYVERYASSIKIALRGIVVNSESLSSSNPIFNYLSWQSIPPEIIEAAQGVLGQSAEQLPQCFFSNNLIVSLSSLCDPIEMTMGSRPLDYLNALINRCQCVAEVVENLDRFYSSNYVKLQKPDLQGLGVFYQYLCVYRAMNLAILKSAVASHEKGISSSASIDASPSIRSSTEMMQALSCSDLYFNDWGLVAFFNDPLKRQWSPELKRHYDLWSTMPADRRPDFWVWLESLPHEQRALLVPEKLIPMVKVFVCSDHSDNHGKLMTPYGVYSSSGLCPFVQVESSGGSVELMVGRDLLSQELDSHSYPSCYFGFLSQGKKILCSGFISVEDGVLVEIMPGSGLESSGNLRGLVCLKSQLISLPGCGQEYLQQVSECASTGVEQVLVDFTCARIGSIDLVPIKNFLGGASAEVRSPVRGDRPVGMAADSALTPAMPRTRRSVSLDGVSLDFSSVATPTLGEPGSGPGRFLRSGSSDAGSFGSASDGCPAFLGDRTLCSPVRRFSVSSSVESTPEEQRTPMQEGGFLQRLMRSDEGVGTPAFAGGVRTPPRESGRSEPGSDQRPGTPAMGTKRSIG